MGCCMCKKVLKILAGLALVGVSLKYLSVDPWLVLGVFLVLVGIAPLVCGCESGACCGVEAKGKKK